MLEVQDHYFHLAKKEGYVARSAFKLQEIDEKFGLFGFNSRRESGPVVIDIGCAPGSRLQYTSKVIARNEAIHNKGKTKKEGLLIGFDLKKVELNLPFTKTFVQDITDQSTVKKILNEQLGLSSGGSMTKDPINDKLDSSSLRSSEGQKNSPSTIHNSPLVDVIISDMAPDTVGNKGTDALRSASLIMETMRMYEQLLKPNGKFTIKVFMGPGFEELVKYCRDTRGAANIKIFKPKACRKESKETYIVKI